MCTSRTCYIGKNDIVITFLKIGLIQGKNRKRPLENGYICDDCTDILDLYRKFVTENTFVFHHIDNFTANTSYVHCIENIVDPIIKVLFDTGCSDGRVLCLMMVLSRIMMNYSNEEAGSVKHLQDNCVKYINHNILPSYDWVKFEKFVREHCRIKKHKNLVCELQQYIGHALILVNILVTLYRSFIMK